MIKILEKYEFSQEDYVMYQFHFVNEKENEIIGTASKAKMQKHDKTFKEVLKNILIYLVMINIIGFFMMWSDKRKAKKGKWRIPEQTLFIVTALGGGIGTIAGMYTFRHKTQKLKFTVGLPVLVILEIVAIIYIKFFY